MMIQVTDTIEIDEDAIETKAIYASGPGGQHINKNMTAIQLRFDILQAYSLPYEVQQRLIELGGSRVNNDYQLVIMARRHRSQERNRCEAFDRLFELVRKAAEVPKQRLTKRRSQASHQERLSAKKRRGETKRMRQQVVVFD
ncbi:MAG: alternative ribosome rescue aminoacyl-tRNA hydrolase ArfB [Pseudomonadota bacterium]|nr:alternative ribosome rescue aminoacyl-tRNA hydrolase ArfB [Pseudomonadota bacterium]